MGLGSPKLPFRCGSEFGPGGFTHLQVSSPPPLNGVNTMSGMTELVRGKHRRLLEDKHVKRWYDNLCRGSKVTADVHTRRLGSICTLRGTNPSELVAQGRKDKEWLCNFLMDLVSEVERQGKAGSYIVSNLKAIKSWLSHNGVDFKRRIKVRGADDTPTLRGKHTLSTGQLVTSLISKVTVSPGSISTAGLWLLPTVVERRRLMVWWANLSPFAFSSLILFAVWQKSCSRRFAAGLGVRYTLLYQLNQRLLPGL